jgi:FkbM family methyltransferase
MMSLATKIAKLTGFAAGKQPVSVGSQQVAPTGLVPSPKVSKHKPQLTTNWPVTELAKAGGYEITFLCRSDLELMRARTLATKEMGTVDWILSDLKRGQVFYDIGANIGVYSLLAGRHLDGTGMVCAFEPHAVNVSGLLANAKANQLEERLKIFSCALNDCEGFFEFEYSSLNPGAAFNSLIGETDHIPQATKKHNSTIREMKAAFSVDSLISRGVIPTPHHIKIDVDGIELRIVHGMRGLLSGAQAPFSVQIEIDPATAQEIHDFMRTFGYTETYRHDTMAGKKSIEDGAAPGSIAHNVVFRRKT